MNKKTSNHELSTPLPHREGQGEGLLGGSAMDRQNSGGRITAASRIAPGTTIY